MRKEEVDLTDDVWQEQRKAAAVQREAISLLLRSEGWDILCAVAKKQVDWIQQQVMLVPLKSIDAVGEQEFNKGHAMGIAAFIKLPAHMLDEAEATLARLGGEREEDSE